MNVYEIYTDTAWDERKLNNKLFGACIFYKNGDIIYNKSKSFDRKLNLQPELLNLLRALNIFKDFFLDKLNDDDIIIIKNDERSSIINLNKCFKIIQEKDESKWTEKLDIVLKCLDNYKDVNVNFEWITRENNLLADKMAIECRDTYLNNLLTEDTYACMKQDLEHTLRKWRKWFNGEDSAFVISKLEEFIDINLQT